MKILKPYEEVPLTEPCVVNDIEVLKKVKDEYVLLDFFNYKRLERGWIVKSNKRVTGLHYDITYKEFIEKIDYELNHGYRFVIIPRNQKLLPSYVYDELTKRLNSIEEPVPYPHSLGGIKAYYKALNAAILKAESNGLYDKVRAW